MEDAVMPHTRMVRSMHTGIDTVQSTEKALHQYNGTLARANGARFRAPSEFEPALNCPAVAGRCARFAVEAVTVSSSSLIIMIMSCALLLLALLVYCLSEAVNSVSTCSLSSRHYLLSLRSRCLVQDDTVSQLCREQPA